MVQSGTGILCNVMKYIEGLDWNWYACTHTQTYTCMHAHTCTLLKLLL